MLRLAPPLASAILSLPWKGGAPPSGDHRPASRCRKGRAAPPPVVVPCPTTARSPARSPGFWQMSELYRSTVDPIKTSGGTKTEAEPTQTGLGPRRDELTPHQS